MKPRRRVDPQERKSASTGQIIKESRETHERDRLKMQTETRVQELMIEVRAYCKAQERV
jgi:hypothetical protein